MCGVALIADFRMCEGRFDAVTMGDVIKLENHLDQPEAAPTEPPVERRRRSGGRTAERSRKPAETSSRIPIDGAIPLFQLGCTIDYLARWLSANAIIAQQ